MAPPIVVYHRPESSSGTPALRHSPSSAAPGTPGQRLSSSTCGSWSWSLRRGGRVATLGQRPGVRRPTPHPAARSHHGQPRVGMDSPWPRSGALPCRRYAEGIRAVGGERVGKMPGHFYTRLDDDRFDSNATAGRGTRGSSAGPQSALLARALEACQPHASRREPRSTRAGSGWRRPCCRTSTAVTGAACRRCSSAAAEPARLPNTDGRSLVGRGRTKLAGAEVLAEIRDLRQVRPARDQAGLQVIQLASKAR